MITHAVEDYLKAIYELEEDFERVGTSALAATLNVTPASVTGMLQRLSEARPRLVEYERHRGAALTPTGRKLALQVIRHHRLIELYLAEALGYGWDQVDADKRKSWSMSSPEQVRGAHRRLPGQPRARPARRSHPRQRWLGRAAKPPDSQPGGRGPQCAGGAGPRR